MRRRYGLMELLFDGAEGIAKYIADERREKRGEMQRNNEYLGDISGGHYLDYIEVLRMEMENIKYARESVEQEQRKKYNFSNRDTCMDDLYAPPAGGNNSNNKGSGSY